MLRRYVALRELANCPCSACGHIDTTAIREDWWRRNEDDALPPPPATTYAPLSQTSGQAHMEDECVE